MTAEIRVQRDGISWCVWCGHIPMSCASPRFEKVSEHMTRLVIEMSPAAAESLNMDPGLGLPMWPAEPPGSQQLALAARAMASACNELTLTLRAEREK